MSIQKQTQRDRDDELAKYLEKPLSYVQALGVATPDSIRIADDKASLLDSDGKLIEEKVVNLYRDFSYLDLHAHLKTLMFTSIHRRPFALFIMLHKFSSLFDDSKKVLDFGSGVGSHSIAALELNYDVDMLDVQGPMSEFAAWRVASRGYKNYRILPHDIALEADKYDIVLCLDVLEHVVRPSETIKRITESMKKNARIFLVVSNMIKDSSGHFKENILDWKENGVPILNSYFDKVGKFEYARR